MMEREWAAILDRYGQEAAILPGNLPVKALIQPILDREDQMCPSPLGERNQERLLYLGSPQVPLEAGTHRVVWAGRTFSVWSARAVPGPGGVSHYWAVLRPCDREVGT